MGRSEYDPSVKDRRPWNVALQSGQESPLVCVGS